MLILFGGRPQDVAQFVVAQDLKLQQAKRLGYKVLVDYVANKTPFPMGGAVKIQVPDYKTGVEFKIC